MINFINKYIFLRDCTLQKKLIIHFSIIIGFLVITIGLLAYKSAEKVISEDVSSYAIERLQQANKSIDVNLQDADKIMLSVFFDRNIRNYINNSQKSSYEKSSAQLEITRILQGNVYARKDITQLFIVDKNNNLYSSNAGTNLDLLQKEKWFKEFAEKNIGKEIIGTHEETKYIPVFYSGSGKVVTILRKYVDLDRNLYLGTMGIDIDYTIIKNIFEDVDVENYKDILLINDDGTIVYSHDEKAIGKKIDVSLYDQTFKGNYGSYFKTINSKEQLIIYAKSNVSGWKLVQVIPVQKLLVNATGVRNKIFLIGLICLMLSIVFSVGISSNVSNPVKKLIKVMNKVEEGNLEVKLDITSHDEIGQISASFNRMVSEINNLVKKIYEEENFKKQAELRLLQQQINPHFLYNTLDSINWMARIQNASNISSAITALIKLLQVNAQVEKDFIKIGEEVEYVKNYIYIQKFRYGNKFEVIYEIDKGIEDNPVLKLILQPLVENAIKHGLGDVEENGVIKISGKKMDNNIVFWVDDNGPGIDEEKVLKILTSEVKSNENNFNIGIENINRRIKLYYGNSFGLKIYKLLPYGTRAEIIIPLNK